MIQFFWCIIMYAIRCSSFYFIHILLEYFSSYFYIWFPYVNTIVLGQFTVLRGFLPHMTFALSGPLLELPVCVSFNRTPRWKHAYNQSFVHYSTSSPRSNPCFGVTCSHNACPQPTNMLAFLGWIMLASLLTNITPILSLPVHKST